MKLYSVNIRRHFSTNAFDCYIGSTDCNSRLLSNLSPWQHTTNQSAVFLSSKKNPLYLVERNKCYSYERMYARLLYDLNMELVCTILYFMRIEIIEFQLDYFINPHLWSSVRRH